MRRRSFKYIFLFNVVFISAIVISVFLIYRKDFSGNAVRANITTPLLHSDTLEVSFCQNAAAAVLVDAKSGAVLYEKNADVRLPMASTTKIMTALVVIENSSPDDVIEISKTAAGVEGSSIYLTVGEKITVRDLLYGLMLESGNDAATALAEGVFGSVKACSKAMNEKAHEIGLVSTNFTNPHGLDDRDHYTTAYELSLITKEALKNDLFREIVSTKSYVTQGEKNRYFSNHNRLLRSYADTIGVKTGYTSKSGRCLVTATSRDGEEYIAVTLNDSHDWNDHREMHSFAFENFCGYEIARSEGFDIYAGFSKYTSPEDVYITTMGEGDFTLNYKVTIEKDIGRVEYSTDSVSLGNFAIQICREEL
ncbi:MAG: D-alanyl-D-alanine carboxypeptidase [Clostridia bacterium]|nr:D-alanyl-D-alanine carboxypeptidase [Clostridia bacterium]